MKNLDCPIAPELKAFADGELGLWRRQTIKNHLKTCSQCQKELIWMQKISEELKEETAPLGADLRARILKNAPANFETEIAPVKTGNRRRVVKRAGLALAAIALLMASFNALDSSNLARAPMMDDSALEGVTANKANESFAAPETDETGAKFSRAPQSGAVAGAENNRIAQLEPGLKSKRNFAFSDGHVKTQNGVSKAADAVSSQSFSTNGDAAANSAASGFAPTSRAVHREGNVSVAVDNAETASDGVANLVKKAGGFVASNQLTTQSDGKRAATLDCRVPVGKFEDLISKIGGLGTVRAKNVSGEDITAQVARASARKVTLGRELSVGEARLKKQLKTARKRDENSLYYARLEVRNLRLQASQARAALETLRKYGDLSTLFVTLNDRQKPAATVAPAALGGLEKTGSQAWNTFLVAAKLPLQLLIWILAYSPLWVPALIIWRKWGRKWLDV